MTVEIRYGSRIEYGTWAAFDEATRIYKVRVIDRRHGDIRFVGIDMPERNRAGLRRINVINCNTTYTTADGYTTARAAATSWCLEDGSRETYRAMLDEVEPIPEDASCG